MENETLDRRIQELELTSKSNDLLIHWLFYLYMAPEIFNEIEINFIFIYVGVFILLLYWGLMICFKTSEYIKAYKKFKAQWKN